MARYGYVVLAYGFYYSFGSVPRSVAQAIVAPHSFSKQRFGTFVNNACWKVMAVLWLRSYLPWPYLLRNIWPLLLVIQKKSRCQIWTQILRVCVRTGFSLRIHIQKKMSLKYIAAGHNDQKRMDFGVSRCIKIWVILSRIHQKLNGFSGKTFLTLLQDRRGFQDLSHYYIR